MNQKTRQALEKSIEHHRRLLSCVLRRDRDGALKEGWGALNCALCKLHCTPTGCHGCPVQERSGRPGCEGTPWEQLAGAMRPWANDLTDKAPEEECRRMIRYLEELRPEVLKEESSADRYISELKRITQEYIDAQLKSLRAKDER